MELWIFLLVGFALYFGFRSSKSRSKQQANNDSLEIKMGCRVEKGRIYKKPVTTLSYEDDDLATFTISYGYSEKKSKNKIPGKWIKPGETIQIKGKVITKGNFYFGGQLSSLDGYNTEASLVDDSLNAAKQPITYEDESLSYWPKYSSLSSGCRGAYLHWLAGSRDNPATPIGYVFIYFYGLERRVVVDSMQGLVDDSEFQSLFAEIIRLQKAYDESRSFLSYSTRLLEIMCLLRPNLVSHPEWEKSPPRDSVLLKYRLAKTVDEGKPIDAELGLAWLKFFPDYMFRTPARRCSSEFNQLFIRLYTKKYAEGILVKPNKTRLKIDYSPASSSLRGGINILQEDLPDPSFLKGPTHKLVAIAEECTDKLDAYSRYLGKQGASRTDISAVLLLPEELNDLAARAGLDEFRQWAESCMTEKDGLVDVSEFWQFTKTPLPEKINKKESDLIQMLAGKAGFGIAPDTRYHHAKPSVDGKLVLFSEGHGRHFEPSRAFNEMGMALRLGAMVASVDDHMDVSERALLKRLIDQDTNLSPVEKRSLHAYLIWRLNTPANVSGLKARLEKLDSDGKASVSRILVGVALADGKIDPQEVKQLEKLYTLLGLDKSLVTGDIHNLTTNKDTRSGIQRTTPATKAPAGFHLDASVLAIHESQTRDVQNMLGTIFVEEEPVAASSGPEPDSDDQQDKGIDATHYNLYEQLIGKNQWSLGEVDGLCQKLGLMTAGAIETINDWVFEKVDAPVLEEEADVVLVDQDIVEELEV